MGAPTTPILDDFNRPNESLDASPNWEEGTVVEAGTSFAIVSNEVESSGVGGTTASGRWLFADYGPDSEVFCTMVSDDPEPNGGRYTIFCKVHNVGAGTTDGYALSIRNTAGVIQFRVQRIDNEVDSDIGVPVAVTMNAGDRFFLDAEGDQLTGSRHDGVSWGAALITETDATYEAATGSIGMYDWVVGATVVPVLDDFGGGTVVVPPPAPTGRTKGVTYRRTTVLGAAQRDDPDGNPTEEYLLVRTDEFGQVRTVP